MKREKAAATVFCILIAILGMCLGFLFGYNAADARIQVTVQPEPAAVEPAEVIEAEPRGPVDLNDAEQEELEQLPGIGPSTAEKITDYREKNGKFSRIEDIKNISGIGEKTYQNLKDFIEI